MAVLIAASLSAAGCNGNVKFMTEDRLEGGLVIILPGIEGESELNRNIRRGLVSAGVYRAMPIHSWGRPVPLAGMLLNQIDFIGNRIAGASIAKMIVDYKHKYAGRKVYVIGHSGGGGVAVFVAEGMPKGRQLDGLVLLSASISRSYDLTKALNRCRNGIVNFYNRDDTMLLGVGTILAGNVDGSRGPSAGLSGFKKTAGDNAVKKFAYSKLYQINVTGSSGDPHTGTTRVSFVSANVAPWVLSSWPATSTDTLAYTAK